MKIFDMHIHDSAKGNRDANKLLNEMSKAGVYGGMVFSAPPEEQMVKTLGWLDFNERLSTVLEWANQSSDRLFPVLWIHPDEENIIEKIKIAVNSGIVAFKMICNDYFVYEEKPFALLKEIASLGVPVIFHTGILWDGNVTSNYNRPLNWESLLDIDGIKFSMGHCSWPWVDECIALYGKFLNAKASGKNVEMFFDLTPGTPKIYRRELLTKLFTIGYDVGDNTLCGYDSIAGSYKSSWVKGWLDIDKQILDELGVSKLNRAKLYHDNPLRFIGKLNKTVETFVPETDDAHEWTAVEPTVKEVIDKWYKKLAFPTSYDGEFYSALNSIPVSDAIDYQSYDEKSTDGKRNLLSYLFMCEQTAQAYAKKGISEKVLLDTLSDIVTWCNNWSAINGELYLGELSWLKRHLSMKLFRLGRLQFCMGESHCDISKYSVKKGDAVLEIHIPEGEKLTKEDCESSITQAKEFFAKYFPDFDYKVFTCHSWLLDDTLKEYLPSSSNILQFGDMFDKVGKDPSYAIIKYLFAFDTTPLNLKYRYPVSSFASAVQKAVLSGKQFYEVLGVIVK
jgi:predicted TIM-barrel fold metal-dependent hydrolase